MNMKGTVRSFRTGNFFCDTFAALQGVEASGGCGKKRHILLMVLWQCQRQNCHCTMATCCSHLRCNGYFRGRPGCGVRQCYTVVSDQQHEPISRLEENEDELRTTSDTNSNIHRQQTWWTLSITLWCAHARKSINITNKVVKSRWWWDVCLHWWWWTRR